MSAFDRISARTPNETKNYVKKSLDVAERIHAILEGKGMNQKDLAEKLKKKPSEISRWMTGLHNFGFKTLIKIENALQEDIIEIKKEIDVKKNISFYNDINLKMKLLPEDVQQEVLDFIEFKLHQSGYGKYDYDRSVSEEMNFVAEPENQKSNYSLPDELKNEKGE